VVRSPVLTIAAVQPACKANDVPANALSHAAAVRAAKAMVVVFPELSLTGYELEAAPVAPTDVALSTIVEACAATDCTALVGAPVEGDDGRLYIAMFCVSRRGVDVAYRKCYLGGEELARFSPGPGPAVLDVDGWRLGIGTCKDTGVAEHVSDTVALGIDVYVAGLVHTPEELVVQEMRAISIAREGNAFVAFASFAGPTGGGYERTAGSSGIWSPEGDVLASAGPAVGGMARASLRGTTTD
jgi:predicted amidohydrolase